MCEVFGSLMSIECVSDPPVVGMLGVHKAPPKSAPKASPKPSPRIPPKASAKPVAEGATKAAGSGASAAKAKAADGRGTVHLFLLVIDYRGPEIRACQGRKLHWSLMTLLQLSLGLFVQESWVY